MKASSLMDGQLGVEMEGSETVSNDALDGGHMGVHLRTWGTSRPGG